MNEMHNIRVNIPLFETFPLLRQVFCKTKKVTKLSKIRYSA